ncbi:MAG: DNA repair protein RecO [Clostridia bacterium]|nr:DNA repair protein RecO [Clostridia bacterium]
MLTVKGLVIRETAVGEADRFITVLTDELGVIRASVRGARRVNSRAGAATRILAYSQFSLVKGRETYIVDTALSQHIFFAAGFEVERLALAQYFCELFGALSPGAEEAQPFLRLLLNALALLEKGEDREKIKAIVELRLMRMTGYTPDLSGCICGNAAPTAVWFLPNEGRLACERCQKGGGLPLSPTTLSAMRYIVSASDDRCFSFRLPQEAAAELSDITERFLLYHLSRGFKTLEFYHSL